MTPHLVPRPSPPSFRPTSKPRTASSMPSTPSLLKAKQFFKWKKNFQQVSVNLILLILNYETIKIILQSLCHFIFPNTLCLFLHSHSDGAARIFSLHIFPTTLCMQLGVELMAELLLLEWPIMDTLPTEPYIMKI